MTPKESAANKEAFRQMSLAEKIDYIRSYYWAPILLIMIALIITGTSLYRHFTKKEHILYIALVNTVVGENLDAAINRDYLLSRSMDPQKSEILFYRDLYLSNDPDLGHHEIAYASKLKLIAVINSKNLDLVLMNQEAYDILSNNEYLFDITELSGVDDALYQKLKPFSAENTVIIADNAIEVSLNEADKYQALTKKVMNGIDISSIPAIRNAGFSDTVYLGIIANTPRLAECCDYLNYIVSLEQSGV